MAGNGLPQSQSGEFHSPAVARAQTSTSKSTLHTDTASQNHASIVNFLTIARLPLTGFGVTGGPTTLIFYSESDADPALRSMGWDGRGPGEIAWAPIFLLETSHSSVSILQALLSSE